MRQERKMQAKTMWKRMFLLTLTLCFMLSAVAVARAAQEDASSALASARDTLVQCYSVACDAEAAGANITELQNRLNVAGALLSHAELAFSQGDYESAASLAFQARGALDGFIAQADSLRASAAEARSWDFRINIVGSAVASVAILAAGAGVWHVLKRRSNDGA
jgi:hypothetical protein